ncbi:MAG: hypothetical protein HC773_12500 [Scytonema sp. CRU_2_7]|nr:hypothetical protein [Scytonema sp. CRU_2_7]
MCKSMRVLVTTIKIGFDQVQIAIARVKGFPEGKFLGAIRAIAYNLFIELSNCSVLIPTKLPNSVDFRILSPFGFAVACGGKPSRSADSPASQGTGVDSFSFPG